MTLTDENRAKLNALVRMLRKGKLTKEDIMSAFDTDERTARDMVSEIAQRLPIPSNSDTKGYKIANSPDDVPAVLHAYNENKKRAENILKRNIPLEEFLRRMNAL